MICYPFKRSGSGFNLAGLPGESTLVIAQSSGDIRANQRVVQEPLACRSRAWPRSSSCRPDSYWPDPALHRPPAPTQEPPLNLSFADASAEGQPPGGGVDPAAVERRPITGWRIEEGGWGGGGEAPRLVNAGSKPWLQDWIKSRVPPKRECSLLEPYLK